MFEFKITANDPASAARNGVFNTPHGAVDTPVFMPVGTCGTIKGLTCEHIAECDSQIILANTYHLLLRPGPEIVRDLGGLHKIMAWDGPILTDSGGYQVFSLADMRKISDDGVVFCSHVDGSKVNLTPARAIEVQEALGADIIMQLDVCPPHDGDTATISRAVELSAKWAELCMDAKTRDDQALLPIQQGGTDPKLRARSAELISALDLPACAIGGLSVGEGHQAMMETLEPIDGQLPRNKPRYLMGVGEPRDIIGAVARGVDMFDCVMPTRNGRNAFAFTFDGSLKLRNACHARDTAPLEQGCNCLACRKYSRGTIRHLFMAREMLGPILLSIHNINFFARLMAMIRKSISEGNFTSVTEEFLDRYYGQREKGQQR